MMKSTYFRNRNPADIVNLLAGIALALSPWVLGFTTVTAAAWNAWLVGAAIALVALWALASFHRLEEVGNGLLGIWAVMAPWVLGFSELRSATGAHVVIGLVVALVAAATYWIDGQRPSSTA